MSDFLEQWDLRLLTQLAQDIRAASAVNPKSWTLKSSNKSHLALGVHQWTVFLLSSKSFECWLPGKHTEDRYSFTHWSNAEFSSKSPRAEGFWIKGLREDQLIQIVINLESDHTTEIRRLASQVNGRCNSAIHHKPQLQDALAEITGLSLVQPSYIEGSRR